MPVSLEIKSLLIGSLEDHNRAAIFHQVARALPHLLTHPGAGPSYKDPRGNLQQPAREVTPQTSWTSGNNQDHHSNGLSSAQFRPEETTSRSDHSTSSESIFCASELISIRNITSRIMVGIRFFLTT